MGQLLKDTEILTIPGVESVASGSLVDLIVNGLENSLESLVRYNLVAQTYTDEQIELPPDVRWEEFVPRPRRLIRVKNVPVRTFTSLKVVDQWGSDGAPSTTTVIGKDRYRVKAESGIIQFHGWEGYFTPQMFRDSVIHELTSSYSGGAILLASYRAGYSLEDDERLPPAARLALLGIIERHYTQMRNEKWNLEQSSSPDGGHTVYLRTAFTVEEKRDLRSLFKRMVF